MSLQDVIDWSRNRRDMWEKAAQSAGDNDLAMVTTWQLVCDLDCVLEMLLEVQQCQNQRNKNGRVTKK